MLCKKTTFLAIIQHYDSMSEFLASLQQHPYLKHRSPPLLICYSDPELQGIVITQCNEALYQSSILLCKNSLKANKTCFLLESHISKIPFPAKEKKKCIPLTEFFQNVKLDRHTIECGNSRFLKEQKGDHLVSLFMRQKVNRMTHVN